MLGGGLALLYLALFSLGQQPQIVRLLVGVLGLLLAVPGAVITWCNVDWLNHCYTYRFTCNAINSHADPWVTPDDPAATYVMVIPRQHWGPLNWVKDRGFLVADRSRRCLTFEGIQYRYKIPAAAIRSCEIESTISGGSLYVVVLRTVHQEEGETRELEIPFMVGWRGWGKSRGYIRLERAEDLQDKIDAARDVASN
jgi:hypothetical protein